MTPRPIRTRAAVRRAPHKGAPLRRARAGFSLVEVLVAITILGTVIVAMATFAARFVAVGTDARNASRAAQIAADRLEVVKSVPVYADLPTLVEDPAVTVPGASAFRRRTLVQRVGGAVGEIDDYTTVTVIVTGPRMPAPVKRTTMIAGF